jgi:hypothetical protein
VIGATLVVAGGGVAVFVLSGEGAHPVETPPRAVDGSSHAISAKPARDDAMARTRAAPDVDGRAVTLSINTTPPGAQVWIDGGRLAVTPLAHRVRAREKHVILVRKKGYQDTSRTIAPTLDQEITLVLVSKRQTKVETGRHTDARVPTLRTDALRIPTWQDPAARKKGQ